MKSKINPEINFTIPELIFSEGHLEATILGEKEITLRQFRSEAHSFKKGDYVMGVFKEPNATICLMLEITEDTLVKPLKELTDEEAREDGFKDFNDAIHGLRRYYPNFLHKGELAVIRYRIPDIAGFPSISYR